MREIRTSGSMSGDGKRRVAAWPKLPRPSSTLPDPKCPNVSVYGEFRRVSGLSPDAGNKYSADAPFVPVPRLTHNVTAEMNP